MDALKWHLALYKLTHQKSPDTIAIKLKLGLFGLKNLSFFAKPVTMRVYRIFEQFYGLLDQNCHLIHSLFNMDEIIVSVKMKNNELVQKRCLPLETSSQAAPYLMGCITVSAGWAFFAALLILKGEKLYLYWKSDSKHVSSDHPTRAEIKKGWIYYMNYTIFITQLAQYRNDYQRKYAM